MEYVFRYDLEEEIQVKNTGEIGVIKQRAIRHDYVPSRDDGYSRIEYYRVALNDRRLIWLTEDEIQKPQEDRPQNIMDEYFKFKKGDTVVYKYNIYIVEARHKCLDVGCALRTGVENMIERYRIRDVRDVYKEELIWVSVDSLQKTRDTYEDYERPFCRH